MKTCPKCNGKYFDDDEYCSECNIKLIDNKEYNKILAELDLMSNEEREKHKYSSRYRDALKYRYGLGLSSQQYTQDKQQNIPKCPICQSTNLSKITNTHKAGKIALFGIFGAGDLGKTWKCNNCGSKF